MRFDQGHQFPVLPTPDIFNDDPTFRLALLRHLPDTISPETLNRIFAELSSFSHRCTTLHKHTSEKLSSPADEPRLRQYDAWGHRIDELTTSPSWQDLKFAALKEGLISDSYSPGRQWLGSSARLFTFAKTLFFVPFSKLVLCPIAMTDGAVRVLELYGTPRQKDLISKFTAKEGAWTAGQWMTERPGGSDVSFTETTAVPVDAARTRAGDEFLLDGIKWFSSATDGDVALALARTNPDSSLGSAGLSLFLVEMRDRESRRLNGIRIHRLKQKLGTKYLPTAELELSGCRAQLVGELGHGVRYISSVLNITRVHSAAGGVASLNYGVRLSAAFATGRSIKNTSLSDLPLHTHSLFRIVVLQRGLQQLFLYTVHLLGKSECKTAVANEEVLLRLYTPALKAFTATRASEAILGIVDSFGGQGYMEDSGLGVAEMLRDVTVERIWEGTAEVLSMDVVRVLSKNKGDALGVFVEDLQRRLASPSLERELALIVQGFVKNFAAKGRQIIESIAEGSFGEKKLQDYRFARPMLDLFMGLDGAVLLLEQAAWCEQACRDKVLAERTRLFGAKVAPEEDLTIARAWIEDVGDIQRTLNNFTRLVDESSDTERNNRNLEHTSVFSAKL